MILVDIGNTSIHFAVVDKNKIRDFRISTETAGEHVFKKTVRDFPHKKIIVSSVVPSVTARFKKIQRDIVIVGEDMQVPIRSFYNKHQIGQDRLLNAFAAKHFHPKARLVIDFGTAITFDFISSRGAYLGGFISPGITLSYKALSKCALLPKKINRLSHSLPKIPKNTNDSIHKGVREGSALMVSAWVKRYKPWISKKKKLRKENIILTGGQAAYVLDYLDFPFLYEPHLLFKGMIFLVKK